MNVDLPLPRFLGVGPGQGMLMRSRSDGPLRRGIVFTANRCQSHLLKIGFQVGVEVDIRVANTLRKNVKTLNNGMKLGQVRSGNGFRCPLFWWESVVSNEQL